MIQEEYKKHSLEKKQHPTIQTDEQFNILANTIVNEVKRSKQYLAMNISSVMVKTYWTIGRYIVEFEQKGSTKAKYGSNTMTKLSKVLTMKLGRGYSRPNLNNMRKFYLLYPICQMSDKLTWSHICELITINDEIERSFNEYVYGIFCKGRK